ncbi:unnamed protein product [Candidula unifasciata]|uniref:Lupus La protein n=1 Tax=Candidula unifasciata TaxID=100452 RepID=A0A8S3ZAU1_9EUPU|nr:unnamed protein product [Candidula unifasciata]
MTASDQPSSDSLTALDAKIIKQIEYYFGDVNLLRDTFLKEKIQEDDGWVTMETMLKFNRLKEITSDAQVICEALKKSSSGLMEVSEQGDKIRRSPSKPLPGDTKERREEILARSIYAKSFPLDVKLDDLQQFFEGYGQVDNVYMKRDFHKKTFKGSVFVIFTNKEDAEKFVSEEGTKFRDQVLEVKSFKADYFKNKAAERKSKGKKDTEGKPDKKSEIKTEVEAETELEERVRQQMTKNAVLHLKGFSADTSREQVKKCFQPYADVGWVDFDKGATEGYIRLREPDSAGPTLEKAKAANDGKIVIQDTEIEVRVVEGDEELQYWKKMFKDIADKKKGGGKDRRQGGRSQRGGRNQRGGRRNRGGPQGKRKFNKKDEDEGGSDGDEQVKEEPSAKVIKTEEEV